MLRPLIVAYLVLDPKAQPSAMRSLFLLLATALAAADASASRVLVLGKSPTPLWHETRASEGFSAAGLADLALNSLGLRSGRVSSRSAVQSPLQADLFAQSEAYAVILLADASAGGLEAVNAALGGVQAFHELFPAQAASAKVPVAVAQEFSAKYTSGLHCAGSAALCASVGAETPPTPPELVQQVLAANGFLRAGDAQDVAFAEELAQLMQLTAELKPTQTQGKQLFLVGLSGLAGSTQRAAQEAAATAVTEFLAQLMKSQQLVGAQVMTGTLPTAVQQTAALSRRTRSRKLVTKLTNEEEAEDSDESDESDASEEDDEEEEEDEEELDVQDLAAASGSEWEDNDNSTATANATATGAVSMPDIAEYQIILWTSVLLGAMLLMAVLAMANMDAGRDSLLYAKFIADVNGRKTN
ncbi:hypothetical protein PHYPSEUDO_013102 [Phytophthora pseudosyringae]|uniref:Uncharacterized protein n=1 Tax=Phytophthora pseudosyringae TaxID=221518 RepID=A0A8T1W2P9_9STRA|nr:hypothetical protein PHYPSEUDO_013102 [Phytophthora pseudosyringae]